MTCIWDFLFLKVFRTDCNLFGCYPEKQLSKAENQFQIVNGEGTSNPMTEIELGQSTLLIKWRNM